jgi:hypothetical protein
MLASRLTFSFMISTVGAQGSSGKRISTAALLLGSVLLVVISTAGVSGAAKSGELTKPVGPRVPKSGGIVRITGYSDNDGPTSRVVVTGVIGDFGKAVRTAPSASNATDNELDLQLTRGSFGLNIAGVERELLAAISGHFPTNATTCSGEVSVSGVAAIDSGYSTGAYKGLSGNLMLTITINEVESPPDCPQTDTSPFLAQTVFISGAGRVSLSS